jgi:hypothetical protein
MAFRRVSPGGVLVVLAGLTGSATAQMPFATPAPVQAERAAPMRLGGKPPAAAAPAAPARRPPTSQAAPGAPAQAQAPRVLGRRVPVPTQLPPRRAEPEFHVSIVSPSESHVHQKVGRQRRQGDTGPLGGSSGIRSN